MAEISSGPIDFQTEDFPQDKIFQIEETIFEEVPEIQIEASPEEEVPLEDPLEVGSIEIPDPLFAYITQRMARNTRKTLRMIKSTLTLNFRHVPPLQVITQLQLSKISLIV